MWLKLNRVGSKSDLPITVNMDRVFAMEDVGTGTLLAADPQRMFIEDQNGFEDSLIVVETIGEIITKLGAADL